MKWALLATAGGTGFGAVVFLALAWSLWRRPRPKAGSRYATRAFALYWGLTGAYQAMTAAEHALAAADLAPFALVVAVRYAGLLLASAGLGALLCYLAYIRQGSRRWERPIVALYSLAAALAITHVARSGPIGVTETPWSIDVAYAGNFQGGLFVPLIVILQLVPMLGAIWYLTLLRAKIGRVQRMRVLAVGVGVSLQLLAFLVARVVESEPWQLVSRTILGFVVALLVWLAYRPERGTLDVIEARRPSSS